MRPLLITICFVPDASCTIIVWDRKQTVNNKTICYSLFIYIYVSTLIATTSTRCRTAMNHPWNRHNQCDDTQQRWRHDVWAQYHLVASEQNRRLRYDAKHTRNGRTWRTPRLEITPLTTCVILAIELWTEITKTKVQLHFKMLTNYSLGESKGHQIVTWPAYITTCPYHNFRLTLLLGECTLSIHL